MHLAEMWDEEGVTLFCSVFLRGAGVCLRIDLKGCEVFQIWSRVEDICSSLFRGERTRTIMNNFILTLCDAANLVLDSRRVL